MNDAILMYQDMLAEAMEIPSQDCVPYLDRFQRLLELFLEEVPEPTVAQLISAFGPADYLARIICHA